ncbi:MAG: NADH-quinone oxidoreductase subunit L, partial [Candidatus Odinarchaeota archaeon]
MAMPQLLVDLSFLIPLLPFLAVPFIVLFRKRKFIWEWTSGGALISIAANFISWIVSVLILIFAVFDYAEITAHHGHIEAYETEAIFTFLENPEISFQIMLDPLAVIMAAVVSTLALLIQIYSVGYMADEPGKHSGRYFAEVSIFVGAMLGLSVSYNFLYLFIFWEIMGLCSYLLIGFFMDKETEKPGTGPASAAKKAFLITKVGDILLFGGFVLMMIEFINAGVAEPLNFLAGREKVAIAFAGKQELQTLIAVLIFGGAVGKSAQFPLHVWLPDAMEGPTTVSALIHSATMVKAGVFLLARCFWIFEGTDALLFVSMIGGFTAFFAATMAFVATDVKKILAYSTISQLAYMILGIGVGGVASGMFHLMSHSFFKCLLFLAAGSIIHSYHTQEITEIRGLYKSMPTTAITFLIGALGLSGIFPFNGFFSKDAIFASILERFEHAEHVHDPFSSIYLILFVLAVGTAFMTGFYIFRAVFLMFGSSPVEGHHEGDHHPHESPGVITYPLMILGAMVILMGLGSLLGMLVEIGFNPVSEVNLHHWFEGLFLPTEEAAVTPTPNLFLMLLSLVVAGSGVILAYLVYSDITESQKGGAIAGLKQTARSFKRVLVSSLIGKGIDKVLVNRYGIDAFYRNIGLGINRVIGEFLYRVDKRALDGTVHGIARITLGSAKIADEYGDRKAIDGFIDNTGRGFLKLSSWFSRMQTGITQNYAVGVF